MEERLRIARELHDVLGHEVALINLQASVAAHQLNDNPDEARRALARIRQAGRGALDGLRATVGLLRQPGEPVAPTEPPPGLWRLDELLAAFGDSGMRVDQVVEGETRPIPPEADIAAFRIIQESLANVRKHGSDPVATVRISYQPSAIYIVVDNAGNGSVRSPSQGDGHGLVGMRERAAMVGGRVETGHRPDGGFRVSAVLPLRRDAGA
jgi:signal transduction histidine kinase